MLFPNLQLSLFVSIYLYSVSSFNGDFSFFIFICLQITFWNSAAVRIFLSSSHNDMYIICIYFLIWNFFAIAFDTIQVLFSNSLRGICWETCHLFRHLEASQCCFSTPLFALSLHLYIESCVTKKKSAYPHFIITSNIFKDAYDFLGNYGLKWGWYVNASDIYYQLFFQCLSCKPSLRADYIPSASVF